MHHFEKLPNPHKPLQHKHLDQMTNANRKKDLTHFLNIAKIYAI